MEPMPKEPPFDVSNGWRGGGDGYPSFFFWCRESFLLHLSLLSHLLFPNQQRTLNKLPTELRCIKFVNKHRLSMRINWHQTCKDVYATCTYSNWASILHTTVGGWVPIHQGWGPWNRARSSAARQATANQDDWARSEKTPPQKKKKNSTIVQKLAFPFSTFLLKILLFRLD